MARHGAYRIPSEDMLIAFESVVRLGSFALAAEELGTPRSTVSRLVANLERQLCAQLLERSWVGTIPTEAGKRFYDAVAAGLGIFQAAAVEADAPPDDEQVVMACSHEAHRFFVMPRYDALSEALGKYGRIRVVPHRNTARRATTLPPPDLILAWEAHLAAEAHVVILEEAVRPVCSPGYAETHAGPAGGPVSGWSGLTFLDLVSPSQDLASWDDWFRVAGRPETRPRFIGCDSYAHALEAAAAGVGIALGWRHLIQRYLETGILVALGDGYAEFDNRYCGVLTERGRKRSLARKCLSFFEQCA